MHLLNSLETRNAIAFRDEVLSIQRLKSFFVYIFWSETKLYFVDGPTILVHFIDRVGSK